MPMVYSVREWGGQIIDTSKLPTRGAVGIVIHHTASPNRLVTGDFRQERRESFELARAIQASHRRKKPAWIDSGQHFTVSRGGIVMEGRNGSLLAAEQGLVIQGAHAGNQDANRTRWGIECEGLYTDEEPPVQLWKELVELCAWLSIKGHTQAADIYGHRIYRATQCPGDVLYSMLPRLRLDVKLRKIELMG